VTLAGCAGTSGRAADYGLATTPDLSELSGKSWVADGIRDPDRELVPGSQITMTFTTDSLSAAAGCNPLRGAASVDDSELVVADLASGLKACEEPLAEQDQWLGTFLTQRPTIERFDDDLWLSRDDTTIHLTAR
jgi:heat shock protein HslJ